MARLGSERTVAERRRLEGFHSNQKTAMAATHLREVAFEAFGLTLCTLHFAWLGPCQQWAGSL